jgi:hypothetical protein
LSKKCDKITHGLVSSWLGFLLQINFTRNLTRPQFFIWTLLTNPIRAFGQKKFESTTFPLHQYVVIFRGQGIVMDSRIMDPTLEFEIFPNFISCHYTASMAYLHIGYYSHLVKSGLVMGTVERFYVRKVY